MNIPLMLLGGMLFTQTYTLIDLATHPANQKKPFPVTGAIDGEDFHNRKPAPKLPLSIELESIQPDPESRAESVVSMLVKNIGPESYALPVGRDGDAALAPKNHGRHEFWFDLKVPGGRYSYLQGQVTYASTDLPDTFLKLAPGDIVRVRLKVNIKWALQSISMGQPNNDQMELSVQGACVDAVFDDNPNEYVLHGPLPDAFSANELRIPIVRDAESTKAPKD